jgi:hypothetical protein
MKPILSTHKKAEKIRWKVKMSIASSELEDFRYK